MEEESEEGIGAREYRKRVFFFLVNIPSIKFYSHYFTILYLDWIHFLLDISPERNFLEGRHPL